MRSFLFLIVISFFFAGCIGNSRDYVEKEILETFQIPAGLNTIESHYFKIRNVNLFYKETLQLNGMDPNAVYEVSGQRASLIAKFSDIDFSLLERVSVFVVNPKNPDDRLEIFYNDQIPLVSNRLELKLLASIANMHSYIKDNKVDIEVRIKFRGFLPVPSQCDLRLGYIVYKN